MKVYTVESSGRTYATLEAARADLAKCGCGVDVTPYRSGAGKGPMAHTIFDDYFGGSVDRILVAESGQ